MYFEKYLGEHGDVSSVIYTQGVDVNALRMRDVNAFRDSELPERHDRG